MAQSDAAEKYIMPIWVFRGSQPMRFVGTGFMIAPYLFVTCWHCVRAPLEEGEYYGVSREMAEGYLLALKLRDLSQDGNGSDLATANLLEVKNTEFTLADRNIRAGDPARTFGYPLTDLIGDFENPSFALNQRVLRGYVTRSFYYEHSGFGRTPSYELDMRAPQGISGGPLINEITGHIAGVVYGTLDAETTEEYARILDSGEKQPEVRRIFSFALAHMTDTLRNATGSATRGLTVAEYVKTTQGSQLIPD